MIIMWMARFVIGREIIATYVSQERRAFDYFCDCVAPCLCVHTRLESGLLLSCFTMLMASPYLTPLDILWVVSIQ